MARARSDESLALSAKLGLDEYSRITATAHITRAGLLTGQGRAALARTELTRVMEAAHRGSGPVEIAHAPLALSMAAQADGDGAAARALLDDARSTIRACPDPGPVITALLQRAASFPATTGRVRASRAALTADFSGRESAVLRLLASKLSQREIGGVLFISFNTVKTHSRSIFRKLGVGTRADAVARARALNLIH
jgi:LuxR family maltose regulon positive regulatory protein